MTSTHKTNKFNPETFPGVKIKISAWGTLINRGWYNHLNKTIYLPEHAGLSYAQHEYGHHLQKSELPAFQYWKIAASSLLNATFQFLPWVVRHKYHWAEKDANRRAAAFFGPQAPIANKHIWPV